MNRYVLDTDHVSLFQGGQKVVVQQVQNIEPEFLATTIITVQEQIEGRLRYLRQAKSADKLIVGYRGLQKTIKYFNTISIVPFTPSASTIFEQLRQQKIRIGTMDLRIAAITLSLQAILVTRNQRDFEKVPHLNIVDWSS